MIRISENDVRVLAYLNGHPDPRSVSQVAASVPLDVQWLAQRLRKLADAGLVRLVESSHGSVPSTWTITEAGRDNLEARIS